MLGRACDKKMSTDTDCSGIDQASDDADELLDEWSVAIDTRCGSAQSNPSSIKKSSSCSKTSGVGRTKATGSSKTSSSAQCRDNVDSDTVPVRTYMDEKQRECFVKWSLARYGLWDSQ